jgi:dCMP deaminase
MTQLTAQEQEKVRMAVRNNRRARSLYSTLRRLLKQIRSSHAIVDYPITTEVVKIYEDEMSKKFIEMACSEAEKSTCARRKVGAVLEKDGIVIAKGHNGVPHNMVECTNEAPCFKNNHNIKSGSSVDTDYCRALHGEESAIIDAARKGKSTSGARLFSTHQPCLKCVLQIIAAGIAEVYYKHPYPDNFALSLLRKAGIEARSVD